MQDSLTPEQLLLAYANGYFPMADSRDAQELYWYAPEERGILPLEHFHIPRSLKKFMRHCDYEVTFDRVFPEVIRACAEITSPKRKQTWINDQIIALYCELAQHGYAHSAECWHEGKLVGGLYGVSLGGAFFGESMFSRSDNASKVALVHLVERLRERNFILLDTQYINDHLLQFGAVTVTKAHYMKRLAEALKIATHFA
ncbi:MAG TPA: leucyl/phenylalanyl-tRNA--protein transferase [Rickettsiales bacterium]|nr:leucyl/phenylalanyl-tRNA--protein transferase [Rickettsiales bacterium]